MQCTFLSCLFGSEQHKIRIGWELFFLSCLFGSERQFVPAPLVYLGF